MSEEVINENLSLIKEVQIHQECFFRTIISLYDKHRSSKGMKDLVEE